MRLILSVKGVFWGAAVICLEPDDHSDLEYIQRKKTRRFRNSLLRKNKPVSPFTCRGWSRFGGGGVGGGRSRRSQLRGLSDCPQIVRPPKAPGAH